MVHICISKATIIKLLQAIVQACTTKQVPRIPCLCPRGLYHVARAPHLGNPASSVYSLGLSLDLRPLTFGIPRYSYYRYLRVNP